MATNSSEDAINNILAITGISRDEAIKILQISGNDANLAMNKIMDAFDHPEGIASLLKQETDNSALFQSAFGNAGYGQHYDPSSNIPSFHIEGGVDQPNSISAAPTRPSSRNTQRPSSAMSTHMGDNPLQSSFYSDNGSMQNLEPLTGFSGVESEQESGIVGSSGTLRPATQGYYDSASWALVPAAKSTEYVPDAALDGQIRKDGPGFIKPTVSDHFLPALLTIFHTIPLVRNALLAPEVTASNYWRGEEWSKGTASAPTITVGDNTEPDASPELEFLYELQRLMAFLDASDRTYASLDSLLQSDAWTSARFSAGETDHHVLKFLLRWDKIYKRAVPEADLKGIVRSVVNVNGGTQESAVLDLDLSNDTGFKDSHLYDYIDDALFGDTVIEHAHILEVSNVLVLNLQLKGAKQRKCKIPARLCVDRYLEENREDAEAIFEERRLYDQQLTDLEKEVNELKWHTPRKVQYPEKMETLKLLETSMRAYEADTDDTVVNPEHAAIFKHLKATYENVERKLAELEDSTKKAQEALTNVSNRFRAPYEESDPDDESSDEGFEHRFDHPYKLSGVILSRTECYVCHPIRNPEHFCRSEIWWHIKYTYKDNPDDTQIDRKETTMDQVVADIAELTEDAILVYANRTALDTEPIAHSDALDAFISKDDANFKREVAEAQAAWMNQEQADTERVGDWFEGGNGWPVPSHASDGDAFAERAYQSSQTLTPDTEVDPPPYDDADPPVTEIHLESPSPSDKENEMEEEDKVKPMEMQEINGGIGAWVGATGHSNASSETVGRDPDVVMVDAEVDALKVVEGEGAVHIENVKPLGVGERKGG